MKQNLVKDLDTALKDTKQRLDELPDLEQAQYIGSEYGDAAHYLAYLAKLVLYKDSTYFDPLFNLDERLFVAQAIWNLANDVSLDPKFLHYFILEFNLIRASSQIHEIKAEKINFQTNEIQEKLTLLIGKRPEAAEVYTKTTEGVCICEGQGMRSTQEDTYYQAVVKELNSGQSPKFFEILFAKIAALSEGYTAGSCAIMCHISMAENDFVITTASLGDSEAALMENHNGNIKITPLNNINYIPEDIIDRGQAIENGMNLTRARADAYAVSEAFGDSIAKMIRQPSISQIRIPIAQASNYRLCLMCDGILETINEDIAQKFMPKATDELMDNLAQILFDIALLTASEDNLTAISTKLSSGMLLGIFDGHGGKEVSELIVEHLPELRKETEQELKQLKVTEGVIPAHAQLDINYEAAPIEVNEIATLFDDFVVCLRAGKFDELNQFSKIECGFIRALSSYNTILFEELASILLNEDMSLIDKEKVITLFADNLQLSLDLILDDVVYNQPIISAIYSNNLDLVMFVCKKIVDRGGVLDGEKGVLNQAVTYFTEGGSARKLSVLEHLVIDMVQLGADEELFAIKFNICLYLLEQAKIFMDVSGLSRAQQYKDNKLFQILTHDLADYAKNNSKKTTIESIKLQLNPPAKVEENTTIQTQVNPQKLGSD